MNETIVKHLNFGESARNTIFKGIEKLTKAVSSTLGASGRCVILEDGQGNPQITKDGVTVADSIVLLDPVENMGAKLLKQAARKTVSEAGDGTTTATVLAHSILKEAYKYISTENHRDLKYGINKAVDLVIDYLSNETIEVTDESISQVASISANNDSEIGNVIAEAFRSVDRTGVVMMETHDEPNTSFDVVNGAQYDKGLKNEHFITNKDKNTAELKNPVILLLENNIENIRQIQGVLEHVIKNNLSLLVVGDMEQSVLSALMMNKMKGTIKVNVIDAPTFGVNKLNLLQDLSLITGATIINEDLGDDMDLITEDHLGSCVKTVTSMTETIIQVDSISKETLEVIKELKKKLKKETNPIFINNLEKRLARLSGKVAIVKVGASYITWRRNSFIRRFY